MCATRAADGKQSELCKIVNPGNGCHTIKMSSWPQELKELQDMLRSDINATEKM